MSSPSSANPPESSEPWLTSDESAQGDEFFLPPPILSSPTTSALNPADEDHPSNPLPTVRAPSPPPPELPQPHPQPPPSHPAQNTLPPPHNHPNQAISEPIITRESSSSSIATQATKPRRSTRSVSLSHRRSPVIFPHHKSAATHTSPRHRTSNCSLSRQSSLHSTYSEAAYRSSNCPSPLESSPRPWPAQIHHSPSNTHHNLHHNIPHHQSHRNLSGGFTPINHDSSFRSTPQPQLDSLSSSPGSQSNHQKKKSRHPSFSYHGLEGKGSTGAHVQKPDYSEAKIVVAMVGLPARGKSYLSNKLQRYLKWLEFSVKVFNVGQHRRDKFKRMAQELGSKEDQSANFFDPNNASAKEVREQMAADCLESLIDWLKAGGNVGIHDATNSTRERRKAIVNRVKKERGMKLIFLESICTDPAVIQANVDVKVASGDPDYDGMPKENAKADFLKRIAHYEANYETINELDLSFCKVVNVGYEVTVNRIDNYLASRVAFYLMNLHITPRSIFFTRHGESQYNVEGKIGGDSQLSTHGMEYAKALPKLIADSIGNTPLTIWTSTLKRTIQTAQHLPYPKLTWKSLDELDAGVCDGMTYEEIEEHYPEDYAARDDDKFNYRYRGGESYRDVVVRLEPVIMELERQGNILIVCHQAVLRCLYAYFHNFTQDELPYLKIPLHTVIKLTPKAYGCDEERFTLPIEAVDTTRPKPVKATQPMNVPDQLDDSPSPSTRPPKSLKPVYS